MRVQDLRYLRTNKARARHCDLKGCDKATREGKPFCVDHVERHDYVGRLLAEMRRREEDDALVMRKGSKAVKWESLTAQEILNHLRVYGSRTLRRICRELTLEPKLAEAYMIALVSCGAIHTTTSRRGDKTLHLGKKS